MTIQTLFGTADIITQMPKPIKFKTIKAVYETLTVRDASACYFTNGMRYTDPSEVFTAFKWMQREVKEMFLSLHLDGKNRIVALDIVSIGTLNQSLVHPRSTFSTALLANAAAIILVHNHPTLDPQPSREDLQISKRLVECGEILGIKVLDHIIIGETYYSFVSNGLM